jgi:hypothetical protein
MIETTVSTPWHEFRSVLKRASRRSVTHGGLAFTMAMLLVGVAAVATGNNLLFLILAAMFSTLMFSGLISRLSLAGLELDFVLPEHIAAGRTLAGRVYIRNSKGWLPSFSIHLSGSEESVLTTLYFLVIPGGAVLDETVEVCFRRRGLRSENGFLFSTGFPFGFVERRAQVTLRRDVLVYPCIDPQPGFEDLLAAIRGDLETQARGRGHDFYRIRPYEALESARHVDWKATAKVGAMQVREFAREQERLIEIFPWTPAPSCSGAWPSAARASASPRKSSTSRSRRAATSTRFCATWRRSPPAGASPLFRLGTKPVARSSSPPPTPAEWRKRAGARRASSAQRVSRSPSGSRNRPPHD